MLSIYARFGEDEDPVNYEGEDVTEALGVVNDVDREELTELRVNFSTETADGEGRMLRRDARGEDCNGLLMDAMAWLDENPSPRRRRGK